MTRDEILARLRWLEEMLKRLKPLQRPSKETRH
jgi:hypothetical protein